MMDQVALKNQNYQMKTNFERALRYPIRVFNNKYVLKTTIYSCLILYLLLSIANLTSSFNEELFSKFQLLYNILRDSVYQILLITSLGYFISKYKFCYWSLLSFYGIIYLKVVWFIDEYVYSFTSYMNIIDTGITIIILSMILHYLYKNHKIILD